MNYETILYDTTGPVATITLNRPQALNAISPQMTAELHTALDAANADPDIRAIILTGAGRGFSSGYDIARRPDGRSSLDPAGVEVADFLKRWWTTDGNSTRHLLHLWQLGKPVIAAVHGWVMGGGFWYSLACDITIAAYNAVFAQPEVRHISNTTFLFAALAGWKAAHRYSLTGDHFDAAKALRLGIINEIVPAVELLPKARALGPSGSRACRSRRSGSTRRSRASACWLPASARGCLRTSRSRPSSTRRSTPTAEICSRRCRTAACAPSSTPATESFSRSRLVRSRSRRRKRSSHRFRARRWRADSDRRGPLTTSLPRALSEGSRGPSSAAHRHR